MRLGCEPHQEHVYKREIRKTGSTSGQKESPRSHCTRATYHMLKDQVVYSELGCEYVDQRRKNARIRYHLDVLKNLGVDIPEPSPVSA